MQPRLYLRSLIESRASLGRDDARALMAGLLSGELAELEMAAMLGALGARGVVAEELAGFVDAMQAAALPLPLTDAERERLVDTCGTGGDGSGTFNISTAAALVAAAAGATVAKHGNRAVTSRCGSADVLEALGVPVDLSAEGAAEALRRHGFAFLHAPSLHPAMRAVAPVRRALGFRTVFNVLGPLANPAGAARQVMGVYAAELVPVVAEAMSLLGRRHAFVVHGQTEAGGMDELAVSGPSQMAEVRDGRITESVLEAGQIGLPPAPVEALAGGDAAANAAILQAIFDGRQRGPKRDVVVLNAAAVLVAAGLADDLRGGRTLAEETLDSGRVVHLVEKIRG